MSSTDKHRVRQLLRRPPTADNSNVEAFPSPSLSRDNGGMLDTQRTHYSLEGAYRTQYSCPTAARAGVAPHNGTAPHNVDTKENVAAYVLQPDGTMAAVRWDDKSALENNSALLAALKQEQEAQLHGQTTGRIQSTSNSKATLPADMLNWLASDDDTFSSYSDSSRGMSNASSSQTAEREFSTPAAPLLSPVEPHRSGDTHQSPGPQARHKDSPKTSNATRRNNIKIIPSSSLPSKRINPDKHSSSATAAPTSAASSSAFTQLQPTHRDSNLERLRQPEQVAAQVHESYWSPQVSTNQQLSESSVGGRAIPTPLQHRQLSTERTSFQQRQLPSESVSPRRFKPEDRKVNSESETSVWEYFKGYQRCATSDF